MGFVNHKLAEGLSQRSVASYERLLNKWVDFNGDKSIDTSFQSGLESDNLFLLTTGSLPISRYALLLVKRFINLNSLFKNVLFGLMQTLDPKIK